MGIAFLPQGLLRGGAPSCSVIHGDNPRKRFVERSDRKGNFFGMAEDTEPVDHKTIDVEMEK